MFSVSTLKAVDSVRCCRRCVKRWWRRFFFYLLICVSKESPRSLGRERMCSVALLQIHPDRLIYSALRRARLCKFVLWITILGLCGYFISFDFISPTQVIDWTSSPFFFFSLKRCVLCLRTFFLFFFLLCITKLKHRKPKNKKKKLMWVFFSVSSLLQCWPVSEGLSSMASH